MLQAYIIKIYKQLLNTRQIEYLDYVDNDQIEATSFDLFLEEDQPATPSEKEKELKLLNKIRKCCSQRRVLASNENFDIFHYLELKYSDDKLLQEAFLAIVSAPSNQSSVERSFSALRILMSHLRYNLSSESLDNILMIHLNQHYLAKIDFEQTI